MQVKPEKHVQQYLQGVNYPPTKDDLVSAADSNDAPQGFIKRLVDLPITEYSGPERLRESLEGCVRHSREAMAGCHSQQARRR